MRSPPFEFVVCSLQCGPMDRGGLRTAACGKPIHHLFRRAALWDGPYGYGPRYSPLFVAPLQVTSHEPRATSHEPRPVANLFTIYSGGPPASAVRFGCRPVPSAGRHLTGQKGFWDGPYGYGPRYSPLFVAPLQVTSHEPRAPRRAALWDGPYEPLATSH